MGKTRRAFTLVELLVVIGIVALLIAILLPALSMAQRSAQRVMCLSNIRQCGAGLLMYAEDFGGVIPAYRNVVVTGYGSTYYPWAVFLAGPDLSMDHWPASPPVPPAKYLKHPVTRCPVIPCAYGWYSSGSYWSYGIYDAANDTKRKMTGKLAWNASITEARANVEGGSWASGIYYRLWKIPMPVDFILLADATTPGAPYAAWRFTPQPQLHSNSPADVYFVHDNFANCLFADGHAESADFTRARDALNGIEWGYDKDFRYRSIP